MDYANLLRGLGRGATADVMGGPVDLATMATNLLIAGGGYGAHKLGLIDQPPDLIDPKNVPFSSDWLAKNTPLEGQGSEYEVGRILPALATLGNPIMSAKIIRDTAKPTVLTQLQQRGINTQNVTDLDDAAKFKLIEQLQPQALRRSFGSRQRGALHTGGSENLALYHNTDIAEPFKPFPLELTHPSLAISGRDKPLVKEFGSNFLVARPQAFEPRTSPSILKAQDFFTPRHLRSNERELANALRSTQGYAGANPKVAETYMDSMDLALKAGLSRGEAADFAQQAARAHTQELRIKGRRLDREMASRLPAGGAGFEDSAGANLELAMQMNPGEWRKLAQGKTLDESLIAAPQFRTLREFENSPKGAGRVLANPKGFEAPADTAGLEMTHKLQRYRNELLNRGLETVSGNAPSLGQLQNTQWLEQNAIFKGKPLTRDAALQVAQQSRKMVQKNMTFSPSEYAELKRYGPVSTTADNWAGFILGPESQFRHEAYLQPLRKQGIPVHDMRNATNEQIFNLMTKIQTDALRGR